MSLISLQAASNPMIAERINLTDVVIRPLIQNMAIILLFVMPLLTMRLFSEEKKSGTIELLLTYPIDDSAFVFGKFLAALALLIIMLLGTFTFPILVSFTGATGFWGDSIGLFRSFSDGRGFHGARNLHFFFDGEPDRGRRHFIRGGHLVLGIELDLVICR